MRFMDKLSYTLAESVKSLSEKSSEVVEISKINLSIRKREKELEDLYIEIGRQVYNQMKNNQAFATTQLNQLVNKIASLENDIETLQKLVFKMQKINACDYCKETYDDDISYCPLCGKSLKI
ncbi:hypothetical protein RH915_07910 [Serpentinicella sp. ANB-PHB4]|uniref:hypothetical protein n=1 Tax=Serpentinicella sp. ANB-PHB4 TaxID=3074076 RepID=UPI0028542E62|nr:hypothetical protein [Serpentinicella sp. ANB-PHB4]MDR5659413.1 hypothetical protein [Serpentinicella sp. ANB-PHB4]